MPDWIDEEFEMLQEGGAPPSEEETSQAVLRWWEQLGKDIKQAIERVRGRDLRGDLSQPRYEVYEVTNPQFQLALRVVLDAEARTVSFEYHSEKKRVAEPLGGFFSLRPRGSRVVPFYSDETLSRDQVLKTLLKPVLFPAMPSEEAA